MTEMVDRVRRVVDRSWGRFVALLESRATGGAGWTGPTRLAGWTVADLVAHAVWGVSMEADALCRARTGAPGAGEGHVVAPSSERHVLVGELRGAVEALLEELGQLSDDDAGRPVPMPYGVVPLSVVLPIFAMEAGVHTNDLAAALGIDEALDPDVCAATVPVLQAFLPVLSAGAAERPPENTTVALEGPSVRLRFHFVDGRWEADDGVEPTATISAEDDSSILLFALGRIPPGDRRISVSGAVEVLDSFKRWCPGP